MMTRHAPNTVHTQYYTCLKCMSVTRPQSTLSVLSMQAFISVQPKTSNILSC